LLDYNWRDNFPNVPEDVLIENQRDVVYLRYCCNYSFVEIAAEVGRPKEAVIRSHKQAMRRVGEFLYMLYFLRKATKTDTTNDIIQGEEASG